MQPLPLRSGVLGGMELAVPLLLPIPAAPSVAVRSLLRYVRGDDEERPAPWH